MRRRAIPARQPSPGWPPPSAFVNEAQECLGGAGYVEESLLARLYREAPLNSIWEGCGNIQCLDVLRALEREPATRAALFAELDAARGLDEALDEEIDTLAIAFDSRDGITARARLLVERMALALQAALLLRAATGEPALGASAEAFCRSRLDDGHGLAFGTLPMGTDFNALIERAMPE
jgi:putative acyl-CoA dehydrogenase